MTKQNNFSCPLYPCFDTLTGAAFKKTTAGRITFACRSCPLSRDLHLDTPHDAAIETLYFHKMRILNPKLVHCNDSSKIIKTLENTKGICKDAILILSENQKKQALEIEKRDKHQNIGIYSSLTRDLTIACAHDKHLRPPPMPIVLLVKDRKIIGEMTSQGKRFYTDKSDCDCVLPPIDFPELTTFAKDIVSSSPGIMLDTWLRKKISIKPEDATLIIGLNPKR
ncbi:MAG: hypothetical protein U9Q92_02270 [archaeon]|nr:hypothetical protein [archaeon]